MSVVLVTFEGHVDAWVLVYHMGPYWSLHMFAGLWWDRCEAEPTQGPGCEPSCI